MWIKTALGMRVNLAHVVAYMTAVLPPKGNAKCSHQVVAWKAGDPEPVMLYVGSEQECDDYVSGLDCLINVTEPHC